MVERNNNLAIKISTIFPYTFNPGMWWKELITWQQKQKPRFAQFSAWLRSWNNLDCKQQTFNKSKCTFFYLYYFYFDFHVFIYQVLTQVDIRHFLFPLLQPINKKSSLMNHKIIVHCFIFVSLARHNWIKNC